MRYEECEAMFRTNVLAALDVALAVARGMAQRKRGHIVMMTSTAARATYRLGVVYCASKAALSSLAQGLRRSEEHTSELQSLMRISYAVFCLKKKNTRNYAPQRIGNAPTQHHV